jgi:hypothetical protein
MKPILIGVVDSLDGLAVIDANRLKGQTARDVPWGKVSGSCSCGAKRAFVYIIDGDYRKDCAKCGLISMYSGRVLNSPPEEMDKCFRFPESKKTGPGEESDFFTAPGYSVSPAPIQQALERPKDDQACCE